MHRRNALVLFVNAVAALMAGSLAAVLGAFALRPGAPDSGRWIKAGAAGELPPNVPVPRVLALSRQDGWYRERARETVFLVRDEAGTVHALSATCTHLGCQVRWDAEATRFRCPCHGGVFDAHGQVVAGPPSRPLDRIDTRVEDGTVLVRL